MITIPNPTVGPGPSTGPAPVTGPGSQPQTAAYSLPGLGEVPRFLIIGALILAALIGWLMQAAGGLLLGGGAVSGDGAVL